jgi:hypothetical protein
MAPVAALTGKSIDRPECSVIQELTSRQVRTGKDKTCSFLAGLDPG